MPLLSRGIAARFTCLPPNFSLLKISSPQVTVLKLEVAELEKEAANIKAIVALMKEKPSLERQNMQKDLQQKTLEIERFSTLLSAKECALENLTVEKEALYDQLELTKKDFQEEKKAARDFVAVSSDKLVGYHLFAWL